MLITWKGYIYLVDDVDTVLMRGFLRDRGAPTSGSVMSVAALSLSGDAAEMVGISLDDVALPVCVLLDRLLSLRNCWMSSPLFESESLPSSFSLSSDDPS